MTGFDFILILLSFALLALLAFTAGRGIVIGRLLLRQMNAAERAVALIVSAVLGVAAFLLIASMAGLL